MAAWRSCICIALLALGGFVPSSRAQSALYTFCGDKGGAKLGRAVGAAGDVDGDGVLDLVAGAHLDDCNLVVDCGSVRVWSGATGAVLWTFYGDGAGDNLGFSVAGGGDVDGDGHADVFAGAYLDDNVATDCGMARVWSGATGHVLATYDGGAANDNLGWALAIAADANGDGFADLAVGAPFGDFPGHDCGYVRLIDGQTGGLLRVFPGVFHDDELGRSISSGDFDDDGFSDLLMGAWHANPNGDDSGAAYAVSGHTCQVLHSFAGDSLGDFFGISVATAPDVDGDGVDDCIVGAHHDDNNGTQSGSARVFSGLTGAILYTFDGDVPDSYFGRSVAGLGDVDGDGRGDIAAGTPFFGNATGVNHGFVRVFSGKDGAFLYQVDEDSPNDLFAFAIAAPGDVDGNGFSDLFIGARDDDNNGTNSGSVRLIDGCDGARQEYGQGCVGSNGLPPRILVEGCPLYGKSVTLRLRDATASSTAVVFVSGANANAPLPGGCTLLVDPSVALAFALPTVNDGSGHYGFDLPTSLPALGVAATVYVQALVSDSGMFKGFTATAGIRIGVK